MKIAELLRTLADLVDAEQAEQMPQVNTVETVAQQEPENTSELEQLARLAGVARATTKPNEQIFPMTAAFPAGTDMHHSKNPADMRSDSISMYPKYSAEE
jgi:hypothetical protein